MPSAPGRRILIVDDETALCEILKEHFDILGYQVETASSGAQAWELVIANPPDLILLDIRMRGEDGFTFLRKVRAFRDYEHMERADLIKHLPIIVMTGAGEEMRGLFEPEHIKAYITKPMDISALEQLIAQTLQGAH